METEASVDFLEPWHIKAMPRKTRQAIVSAAAREELTVAQWLERRMGEWLGGGMPTVIAPPPPSAGLTKSNLPVKPAPTLHELVEAAVLLASQPSDNPLLREARALTRALMRAERRRAEPVLPRLAAQANPVENPVKPDGEGE